MPRRYQTDHTQWTYSNEEGAVLFMTEASTLRMAPGNTYRSVLIKGKKRNVEFLMSEQKITPDGDLAYTAYTSEEGYRAMVINS